MRLTNTFFYALLPAAAHTAVDYRLRKARKTPATFHEVFTKFHVVSVS